MGKWRCLKKNIFIANFLIDISIYYYIVIKLCNLLWDLNEWKNSRARCRSLKGCSAPD